MANLALDRGAAAATARRAAADADGQRTDRGNFLGRDEELARLPSVLERSRLVTLTGPPGIGKSRLGLQLAGELESDYDGGVWLAELTPVRDGRLVARVLATALGAAEIPGVRVEDTVIERLRERRGLVVLDNCEHVLSACTQLVMALLAGCPQLSLLTTSREPLGVVSETLWQVPPLSVPGPRDAPLPDLVGGYDAVRLFVERARAVDASFELNAYVTPAVAEICRRLDGIPLALELAAARVDRLTPSEIASRLDDRFSLLSAGGQDQAGRHETLLAALDWSHDLLSPQEQALLRRLSVFDGGFCLEACETICSLGDPEAGEIAALLDRLVAKSLVISQKRRSDGGRYRLLETIRAYGGDRLDEAGETTATRDAHAEYHLSLAELAERELTGARQQQWLERLEADRVNLRVALEWMLSRGRAESALRLSGALTLFWRVRCHFSEGRELLAAAVAAGEGRAAPATRAKGLWGQGFMAAMAGDREEALAALEQSLDLYRDLGDLRGEARALLLLGSCAQMGKDARARSLYGDSATLAREARDAWCLSHALAMAGLLHSVQGELDLAAPLFEEGVAIARQAQDKQGLRMGLLGLGAVAWARGDYRSGRPLLEEAAVLADELGEDYIKAQAQLYLGQGALGSGEYTRARKLLDGAVALTRHVAPNNLLVPLVARAQVSRAEGEREQARALLEEALALARAGAPVASAAIRGMGELAADEGDLRSARRLLEESLDVARSEGNKRNLAQSLYTLAQLARSEGDIKQAARLHSEALQVRREIGQAPGVVASVEALAGLAAANGRQEHACRLLAAVHAVREREGFVRLPWEAARHEADLALLRQKLAPELMDAAYAEGRRLSLEQAATEASKGRKHTARDASGWASLTDSERQVAHLVAEDLTNPGIAERLVISPHTVKTHVSSIFRKLGMSKRSELSREVMRRNEEWPRADPPQPQR